MGRPGGALASRPVHFFWVVDCSGSMEGTKIGAVNDTIQEVTPIMKKTAEDNPNAQLLVRALQFSDGASWIADMVNIEDFHWQDLQAGGMTDIGEAFNLLAGQLSMPPMPQRALPPVIVLLSDGQPTDDYKPALERLLKLPWYKKSVRIAIAIGDDADNSVLEQFTRNKELVLNVHTRTQLVKAIRWASTVAASVSAPSVQSIPVSNDDADNNDLIQTNAPPELDSPNLDDNSDIGDDDDFKS